MSSNIHPSCRAANGRLQAGQWREGYELTASHKANVREKAIRRGLIGYKHISVAGVVYPNVSNAAEKTGISNRSLRRYAVSELEKHKDVFYVE